MAVTNLRQVQEGMLYNVQFVHPDYFREKVIHFILCYGDKPLCCRLFSNKSLLSELYLNE